MGISTIKITDKVVEKNNKNESFLQSTRNLESTDLTL